MSIYLDHFGLRQPPFRITPDPQFFFGDANRGPTLEALQYAILNGEGLVKIIGEVGSGKTMLCRVLSERLPKHVDIIYIANPSLSRDEILLTLATDLGLQVEGVRFPNVLRELQQELIERHAQGRQTVVLIDEAHAMPDESLEEIRLLSNLETTQFKLLQLVLFAQPELDERLDTQHMRQLRERITFSFEMPPLQAVHVARYLDFRMRIGGQKGPRVFGPLAGRLIASASLGLIRRINILAEKSLLSAFAAGRHSVTALDAWRACRDSRMPPTTFLTQSAMLAAAVVAGLSVAAMVIGLDNRPEPGGQAQNSRTTPVQATLTTAPPPAAAASPSASEPATTASASASASTSATASATATASTATTGTTAPASSTVPALTTAAVPASAVATTTVAATTSLPVGTTSSVALPVAATPTISAASAAGRGTQLTGQPVNNLTVQLMYATAPDDPALRAMQDRAVALYGADAVFVLPARVAGQDAFVLCVHRFSVWSEGSRLLQQMPTEFKRFGPQIRSVERLGPPRRRTASSPG